MKLTTINSPADEMECDAIVVGVYADGSLTAAAEQVNNAMDGVLTRLIESEEITGKANEATTILAPVGLKTQQLLAIGLGDPGTTTTKSAFQAAGTATKLLAKKPRGTVAMLLEDSWAPPVQESAIAGAISGCVGQDLYREKSSLFPIEEILWPASYDASSIQSGEIVGNAINLAKRLVNEPPSALYPQSFVEHAEAAAVSAGFEIETWDEKRLDKERCHSLLAVGRCSDKPPRLCVMKHNGGKPEDPVVGLVGKGVTFDSGGLSLKPSEGMKTMKCDMAGAAAVVGAMQAIAQLKLPVNVVGVVGLVENMPGFNAFKLGDVLTARNGTTIEVHNTDAEGRLVLADALCVARDQGAEKLVDLATLTGACVVALGEDIVGVMTNNVDWCSQIKTAADTAGEDVWQLPMSKEFDEQIVSKVADIKNVGAGRWGGAITAAKLLERFVDDKPWVHLDIAGPSFLDSPKSWQDAGGTGVMVRTLVQLCRK